MYAVFYVHISVMLFLIFLNRLLINDSSLTQKLSIDIQSSLAGLPIKYFYITLLIFHDTYQIIISQHNVNLTLT